MNRRKLLLSILTLALLGGLSAWSFNASATTGRDRSITTSAGAHSKTTGAKSPDSSKSSKTSAPTTLPAPTTTVARNPTAYGLALFGDWMRRDRTGANKIATPAVVHKLFSQIWHAADGWTAQGCSVAAGSTSCAWSHPHRRLVLQVRNATGSLPLLVVGIQSSSH
jgi:hypothetical protein